MTSSFAINPIPEEPGLDELIKKHGGKNLIATPRYEDAVNCNTFIVLVPLFIDETNNPDFSILELAIRDIGEILKKGDLVVLETTVPPMTTEILVRKWLEEESKLALRLNEFYLAHSPERIMTGSSISRFHDELFRREELEQMGLRWIKPDEADLVFNCFELKMRRSV
jgi:UDP-N-acetyl-D-mannosaminuronic acid dehydrogenase